ncbi:MAG: metal-dependent transcriptional regulator [Alkalispirochaeta sp.]|jgi:DtxR family Mn-dependent transcriptional regulator
MTEQLTDSLARYVLAIYELAVEHKVARSKDIADLVGVSRPSVTGALQKLAQMGLIEYEPYEYVVLTQRGENEARQLLLKHRATQDFLELALGLSEERARSVADAIEQSLPADVLCRLVQFNNFYRTNPDKRFQWTPACRNLCEIMYGLHGPRECHTDGGRIPEMVEELT